MWFGKHAAIRFMVNLRAFPKRYANKFFHLLSCLWRVTLQTFTLYLRGAYLEEAKAVDSEDHHASKHLQDSSSPGSAWSAFSRRYTTSRPFAHVSADLADFQRSIGVHSVSKHYTASWNIFIADDRAFNSTSQFVVVSTFTWWIVLPSCGKLLYVFKSFMCSNQDHTVDGRRHPLSRVVMAGVVAYELHERRLTLVLYAFSSVTNLTGRRTFTPSMSIDVVVTQACGTVWAGGKIGNLISIVGRSVSNFCSAAGSQLGFRICISAWHCCGSANDGSNVHHK